ncbi:MAG: hypothetical protein SAJ12_09675 [Jaaginema sp. PMC 1079.18]|nr:hypothetical protein [Jaaginema sp. PMC 1080.18]MEC4851269.1 hypothetical protein [Jaaginema sp. PMC 1079.18]MEC4868030.1 hypothetical protein [Jaaginema sp. PMC 1078.18]
MLPSPIKNLVKLSEIRELSDPQIADLVCIIDLMKHHRGLKADAEEKILTTRDRVLLNQAEIVLNNYLELIAEIREIASENSLE